MWTKEGARPTAAVLPRCGHLCVLRRSQQKSVPSRLGSRAGSPACSEAATAQVPVVHISSGTPRKQTRGCRSPTPGLDSVLVLSAVARNLQGRTSLVKRRWML